MEVWGAKSGSDGDFIDLDGTMTISGATFFAGGNAGMVNPNSWQNSQNKILGQNSVSANGIINIVSGSNTIKSYSAPKNVGYLYYTSPNVDSTYSFSITSSNGNNNNGNSDTTGNTNGSDTSDETDVFVTYSDEKYIKIHLFIIIISIFFL